MLSAEMIYAPHRAPKIKTKLHMRLSSCIVNFEPLVWSIYAYFTLIFVFKVAFQISWKYLLLLSATSALSYRSAMRSYLLNLR